MSVGDIDDVTSQLAKASVDETFELSFAGKGLKLDTENDAQSIVEALKRCSNLHALRLQGNTLGIPAAKAIGKALEGHPEFKRALWSDLFTGRLKSEIPEALRYLCGGIMTANATLVELDLSDNAFGPNGMTGLTDFLESASCYTLQELRLHNNGLGIQGGKMLAQSLLKCHESSVKAGTPLQLRVFVSGRGRLENEGATALSAAFKAMKSLEEVQMPQNGIQFAGIQALAEALAVNTNLKHINLSDNTFTEKGAVSMAQALPHLQQLEVINFEDCLTRSKGAKILAETLKSAHNKLKVLNLSGNELDTEAALAVIEAVRHKTSLEHLELNTNQFGEEGVTRVRNLIQESDIADVLGSLSDDEGVDDDDEEHDDDDDDDHHHDDEQEEHEEPEDDDDGEELEDTTLQIRGTAITPRGDDKEIDTTDPVKVAAAFMKLSLVVTPEHGGEANDGVFSKVDTLLSKAMSSDSSNMPAIITNEILVQCALIKDEKTRQYVNIDDIWGPLTVLKHVVQQAYLPELCRTIFRHFLQRDQAVLKKCQNAVACASLLETLGKQ